MIRHNRGNRRRTSYYKALRKKNLEKEIYCQTENNNESLYDNLHQYSKNKIHCSCPLCSSKTNNKLNKSKGPVDQNRAANHLVRIPGTNHKRGKKNYKYSDEIKMQTLDEKYNEYLGGDFIND